MSVPRANQGRGRWIVAGFVALILSASGPANARDEDGRLGLIRQPASTHPVLVRSGDEFAIVARAPADASGFRAELSVRDTSLAPIELPLVAREHDERAGLWRLKADVPADAPEELYDLRLSYDGGEDTSRIAVKVFDEWPERYTVAHYADTQNIVAPGATLTMQGIVRDLNALQPTFAIVTGDLVNTGEEWEYRDYIEMLEESRVPTFHVPGNHDVFWVRCDKRAAYQERYEDYVGPRDYSFDVGRHHYAGFELSGYKSLCPHAKLSDEQIAWLEDDLAAAKDASFKVLFGHQVEHKSDALEQLTLKHEVDAYLYGHIHEDDVPKTEPTLFAAVGWAGNGHYRLFRIENDEILSYTYAGDSIDSIPGAFAVVRDLEREPDGRHVRIKYTNRLAQRFDDVSARVEMPLRDEGQYVASGGDVWRVERGLDADYVYLRNIEIAPEGVTFVDVAWEDPDEEGGAPGNSELDTPARASGCRASPESAVGFLAVVSLAIALAAIRRRERLPQERRGCSPD